MSYIAALNCNEGVVLVADTQETYGDHKQYAEKIAISRIVHIRLRLVAQVSMR